MAERTRHPRGWLFALDCKLAAPPGKKPPSAITPGAPAKKRWPIIAVASLVVKPIGQRMQIAVEAVEQESTGGSAERV